MRFGVKVGSATQVSDLEVLCKVSSGGLGTARAKETSFSRDVKGNPISSGLRPRVSKLQIGFKA